MEDQKILDTEIKKQLFARHGNWYYEKARKAFNNHKYEECLKLLEDALKLHITKDKLYLKANAYIQTKMPEKAADAYREILKRDPNDYSACEFMNQFGFKY